METQICENKPLISGIQKEALQRAILQAFLMSAPQLIFQLSVVLGTGFISKKTISSFMPLFSIQKPDWIFIISKVSFVLKHVTNYFFQQRYR